MDDALSPAELVRYSRQLLLPAVGEVGQVKLKRSKVLVVGAGGLGSPAALYLAAAGVGTVGIADLDQVEASNLHRQLLHSDATIGEAKTRSAAQRLAATNPLIAIRQHAEGITAENAVGLFGEYDVIVDGTDNFSSRYLNNDAAVRAKRPLVFGSVYRLEGQVSVFAPHLNGPCYRCLFAEPPPPGSVPGCGEVGVMGALCGVIGSLQALEAVKLITGAGQPLIGRLLTHDALAAGFSTLPFVVNPHCECCAGPPPTTPLAAETYECMARVPAVETSASLDLDYPLELSVKETRSLLDDTATPTHLIDVREPHECAICRIEGAEPIPMRQIPEAMAALPRDQHLLIYCHHGSRSRRVVEYLRSQGYGAVSNVGGGIHAWAQEIEPDMMRY